MFATTPMSHQQTETDSQKFIVCPQWDLHPLFIHFRLLVRFKRFYFELRGACVRGSSASAIVRWLSFVCCLCQWVVCIGLSIKVCVCVLLVLVIFPVIYYSVSVWCLTVTYSALYRFAIQIGCHLEMWKVRFVTYNLGPRGLCEACGTCLFYKQQACDFSVKMKHPQGLDLMRHTHRLVHRRESVARGVSLMNL